MADHRRPRRNNAHRLVAGLAVHDYLIHGESFEIYRHRGQGMMNKAAGEAAPTWELLANPLRHALTGRIVSHGELPDVTLPTREGDPKKIRQLEVCSHEPLLHILAQPPLEWVVFIEELMPNRLTILTNVTPVAWG